MGLSLHERQEIIDPIFVPESFRLEATKKPTSRYAKPRNQIPQEQWNEVYQRHSRGESYRQLAEVYGVSYEAIRQVVKKVEETSIS